MDRHGSKKWGIWEAPSQEILDFGGKLWELEGNCWYLEGNLAFLCTKKCINHVKFDVFPAASREINIF